jgi:hypothetical protein
MKSAKELQIATTYQVNESILIYEYWKIILFLITAKMEKAIVHWFSGEYTFVLLITLCWKKIYSCHSCEICCWFAMSSKVMSAYILVIWVFMLSFIKDYFVIQVWFRAPLASRLYLALLNVKCVQIIYLLWILLLGTYIEYFWMLGAVFPFLIKRLIDYFSVSLSESIFQYSQ